MLQRALSGLTVGSALGCGLIAGVFFAFSSFVMPALARLPAAQGIAAMQSINVVVLNRSFLGAFVGTAIACAILGFASLARWSEPAAWLAIVGGILYIVGTFGVTMKLNVPLNDAMAQIDPESPGAAAAWASYVKDWTLWNSVRAGAALAGCASLIISLLVRR